MTIRFTVDNNGVHFNGNSLHDTRVAWIRWKFQLQSKSNSLPRKYAANRITFESNCNVNGRRMRANFHNLWRTLCIRHFSSVAVAQFTRAWSIGAASRRLRSTSVRYPQNLFTALTTDQFFMPFNISFSLAFSLRSNEWSPANRGKNCAP